MTHDPTDRPISGRDEDVLDRGGFTERLARALVDEAAGVATGAVIGITGAWGSGKSSALNLLAQHISETRPDAVIVRFDPWLVSGRSDLISQFISELKAEISAKPKASEQLRAFGAALGKYGAMLAPGANLLLPGIGTMLQGGLKATEAALNRTTSLAKERQILIGHLNKVSVPIVVLIDELDRVEDDEIVVVAQLVRSVIDFPRISYVLAYDVDRVVEALGRSSVERGRAYLEKIVSLQIPLPLQLREERSALLRSELRRQTNDTAAVDRMISQNRFAQIEDLLLRELLSTPRDIKRVAAAFQTLHAMVRGDVDALDVLAYAAIAAKLPQTAEWLKRHPERLVMNPVDRHELNRRINYSDASYSALTESALVGAPGLESGAALLTSLFPFLRSRHEQIPTSPPDAIAYRRPLLTLLRLGAIPGDVGSKTARSVLGLSRKKTQAAFLDHLSADTLGSLIDRIESIYHAEYKSASAAFWLGVSDFVRPHPADTWEDLTIKANAFGELAAIPFRTAGREAKSRPALQHMVSELVEAGEVRFTARWIRSHFARHGLFGQGQFDSDDGFLESTVVQSLAKQCSETVFGKITSGSYYDEIISFDGVSMLRAMKLWGPSSREALASICAEQAGLDRIAFLLFRSRIPERTEMEDLGLTGLRTVVRMRLQNLDRQQTALRSALLNMTRAVGA